MTLDNKINTLKSGRSVVISTLNGITVRAERSCDGKTLRVVRESSKGFEVISKRAF